MLVLADHLKSTAVVTRRDLQRRDGQPQRALGGRWRGHGADRRPVRRVVDVVAVLVVDDHEVVDLRLTRKRGQHIEARGGLRGVDPPRVVGGVGAHAIAATSHRGHQLEAGLVGRSQRVGHRHADVAHHAAQGRVAHVAQGCAVAGVGIGLDGGPHEHRHRAANDGGQHQHDDQLDQRETCGVPSRAHHGVVPAKFVRQVTRVSVSSPWRTSTSMRRAGTVSSVTSVTRTSIQ